MGLGLQSFCLRGIKDNRDVALAVKACGLNSIELCGVHSGWDDAAAFGLLAQQYRNLGVRMVSIGVNKIDADRPNAVRLFECAKAAGLNLMSVDFPLQGVDEALRIADELSEQYGLFLGIHNHGGRHWLGSSAALRWVFGKTSSRVGLSLDTAWAIDSHENPIEMVKEFGDRLHIVHIKDFVFGRDRTPEDVIVGTGNLDLQELDRALSDAGFAGEAILEYEGDVDNPVPALTDCVRMVKQQMNLITIPASDV